MQFYVKAHILNDGATKTWKQSFYVTADSIELAIEAAQKAQSKSPYSKYIETEIVSRTDGPSFYWINPKYIVGA